MKYCDECGEILDKEGEEVTPVLCGDCQASESEDCDNARRLAQEMMRGDSE